MGRLINGLFRSGSETPPLHLLQSTSPESVERLVSKDRQATERVLIGGGRNFEERRASGTLPTIEEIAANRRKEAEQKIVELMQADGRVYEQTPQQMSLLIEINEGLEHLKRNLRSDAITMNQILSKFYKARSIGADADIFLDTIAQVNKEVVEAHLHMKISHLEEVPDSKTYTLDEIGSDLADASRNKIAEMCHKPIDIRYFGDRLPALESRMLYVAQLKAQILDEIEALDQTACLTLEEKQRALGLVREKIELVRGLGARYTSEQDKWVSALAGKINNAKMMH